jgi:hypothetical protein
VNPRDKSAEKREGRLESKQRRLKSTKGGVINGEEADGCAAKNMCAPSVPLLL